MNREDLLQLLKDANRIGLVISPLVGFIVIVVAHPGGADGVGLFVLALIGAGFGLAAWVIPQGIIRRWNYNQNTPTM